MRAEGPTSDPRGEADAPPASPVAGAPGSWWAHAVDVARRFPHQLTEEERAHSCGRRNRKSGRRAVSSWLEGRLRIAHPRSFSPEQGRALDRLGVSLRDLLEIAWGGSRIERARRYQAVLARYEARVRAAEEAAEALQALRKRHAQELSGPAQELPPRQAHKPALKRRSSSTREVPVGPAAARAIDAAVEAAVERAVAERLPSAVARALASLAAQ